MPNVAILILAAGQSSRMGRPKQLLKIGGQTLLQQAIKTALNANPDSVLVVLGAEHEKHTPALQDQSVQYVVNPDWKNGIGSSIKAGLKKLTEQSNPPQAVIIMVCDQPYVTSVHLQKLIHAYVGSGKEVVASAYAGTTGTPALFANSNYTLILSLQDHEGAKKIINQSPLVATVELEHGEIDLDTPEDYETFIRNSEKN